MPTGLDDNYQRDLPHHQRPRDVSSTSIQRTLWLFLNKSHEPMSGTFPTSPTAYLVIDSIDIVVLTGSHLLGAADGRRRNRRRLKPNILGL